MTEELNISEDPQQVEENQQPIEDNQPADLQEEIQAEETVETTATPETIAEAEQEKTEEPTPQAEETPTEEVQTEENQAEEQAKPKKKHKSFLEARPQIIPNTDDFNWDELGKDKPTYSETEQKQLEDIYNQTFNAIVEQEVVEGIIVAKNTREVVVNIGFKSDGVLPANELRYMENLQIGDKVEVYVESQEDASGQLLLSHKKARLLKSWERVNQAHDTSEIITGHVKSKTKGGLIVDVFGIEAFLPGSQIDVKPIRDYDIFVDKTMEFKVVKINHEFKNVVVSHKALIES
ncbi:MAG: S1 RNA-binding domain-containing protein, partial [Bacteroidales bacterium]|nr:S1 RNA-binding domain-containing protein [Bacteroidales bacterium]